MAEKSTPDQFMEEEREAAKVGCAGSHAPIGGVGSTGSVRQGRGLRSASEGRTRAFPLVEARAILVDRAHRCWLRLSDLGGIRVRRIANEGRRWLGWAAVYLGGLIFSAYWLSQPGYGLDAGVGTIGLIACWPGGLIHALAIRKDVLE